MLGMGKGRCTWGILHHVIVRGIEQIQIVTDEDPHLPYTVFLTDRDL